MTEWQLRVKAPCEWINANQRIHWAKRARLTKAWRDAGHMHARSARLPKGLARVAIVAHLRFPDRLRRDPHNYYPSLKAIVDGLVDYGLIPDDNARHLVGPDPRLAAPLANKAFGALGEVLLIIRDVPAGQNPAPVETAVQPALPTVPAGTQHRSLP